VKITEIEDKFGEFMDQWINWKLKRLPSVLSITCLEAVTPVNQAPIAYSKAVAFKRVI
jgi:hypothetical protein